MSVWFGSIVRRLRSRAAACAVAMIGVLAVVAPAPAAAEPAAVEPAVAAPAGTECREVTVPVTIAGQTGPIAGTLCVPPGATTVQVLVHGLSYGRYYWDLPYQHETYSYVQDAGQAGYATLAIDRLGIGESWHPASALVTYDSNANAVHQVVQAARGGDLGSQFEKVVLVGHSLGSVIGYLEAGTYQDVDAAVFTGGGHRADNLERTAPVSNAAILDFIDRHVGT
ncbi:MAG: alpha/beta fold hydrolase [Pseudonocardiaceae bacterium]|nr:alpha/beta fold hydrolase [Pseudonocardiaceae bacterium]